MADKEVTIKVSTETDINNLDDLTTALDTSKDKAEELGNAFREALQEAEAEVEELTEELAQIEMGEIDGDFDEVASQLEEATDKAEALQDALNSIDGGGLSDAESSAEDLAGGLDDATQSANDLADSMGLIEGVMLMDVANQIGAIGDSAEGMAQEMNTASITVGQLAINAGMAEPQMVSLINYISNSTFPQEEAMAYVNVLNQMGVSADKLGASATNMDRINDATGMGYDKVMLLTQGLTALGISADDLPSAFNAIAYAEANVGGGAETLQQVLRRQAGTLKEYGMGVDETVVALDALQQQTGLTGMKLGTEFSSRLKECNGDLKQLEQSLGLQEGALSNAKDATGEYAGVLQNLADEEKEHKTFIDELNSAWEDVSLTLAPILSPMASLVGIIGSFGQTALAVNSLITLAQTFGLVTVSEEGLTIAQWTLNASMLANPVLWLVVALMILVGVLIWAYYNCEDFRNAVDSLGQWFIWLGQIIYSSVMGTLQWLASEFQKFTSQLGLNTNDWTQAILGFILFLPQLPLKLGQALLNAIAKALGFGDNFTQTMVDGANNAVNGFINWIVTLPSKLKQEFDEMLDMASDFAIQIADKLSFGGASMVLGWLSGSGEHSPGYMYDALVNELIAMVNAPLEFLADLPDNLFTIGSLMVEALQETFEGTPIGDFINRVIDDIMQLSVIVGNFNQYILSVGGLLSTNVNITGNKVIDTLLRVLMFVATLPVQLGIIFTNMIAETLGFGTNFVQRMYNSAQNAVSQFINQIKRLPSQLASELGAMINEALNFAGRIGSILWQAGVNMINGLLGGMQRRSPGKMQREFVAELNEMGERVPSESALMITNLQRLGKNVSDAFSPSFDKLSFDNSGLLTSNGNENVVVKEGDTIVNIYGDVDNEDRVNFIIETFRKEIAWNNETAGRTN